MLILVAMSSLLSFSQVEDCRRDRCLEDHAELSSFHHCEKRHRHFIKEVLDGGQILILENGFVWNVSASCASKTAHWHVGDEVALHANKDPWNWHQKDRCCLKNLRTSCGVRVDFDRKQKGICGPTIADIDGTRIILTDGSCWEVASSWDILEMWDWCPGDRALIFSDLECAPTFTLLNFDAHACGTCIQVLKNCQGKKL